MAINSYYVDPGSDYSQGLAGLGKALQQYGQVKQQRQKEDEAKQRLAEGGQALQVALDSGNADEVAKVSLEYPDLANTAMALHKFKSEATKENMLQGMRRMLSGEDPNAIFEERVKKIYEEGGDPTHTVKEWQRYREDPEGSFNEIKNTYALYDQSGYATLFGSDKKSNLARQLEEAGFKPGTPEFTRKMVEMMKKPSGTTVNIGSGGPSFDTDQKLRKELMGLTKDYQQVEGYGRRVQAAAGDPSAAGDIALIFNYMKMLDPNSVVREGEFATAENAGGVSQQVRAQWNKLIKGERLTEDQRQQFVRQAKAQYMAAFDQYKTMSDRFSGLATGYGLDPQNITGQVEPLDGWDELLGGGLPVGTVEGGYRFIGGSPSDPNAWKAVR